jgi:hypothetical protein
MSRMNMRALLLSTLLVTYVLVGAIGVANLPTVHAQNQTAGAQNQQPAAAQQQEQEFTANLTGSAEVPPVETNATGTGEFVLNEDGDELSYNIEVEDLEGVLMAHIHQGGANENGPIGVWLYNSSEPSGEISGELSSGTITAEDLVGPWQGQNVSDLADAIRSGQAYVNVHTEANPGGELRGTIEQAPAASAGGEGGGDDQGGGGDDESGG